MTICCWEKRLLNSIYVHVKLAKNGRNGEESGAYLYRDEEGAFEDNFSVVHFMDEYWFPFLKLQGIRRSQHCSHSQFPAAHCTACPPLFPTWPKQCQPVKPVTTSEVSSVVKKWATKLKYDASKYSAISFRRGSVSVAAAAKVARNIRKRHCRWKSKKQQDDYTEASVEEQLEFGRALQAAIRKSKACSESSVTFKS